MNYQIEQDLGWKIQTDKNNNDYNIINEQYILCPNCDVQLLQIILVKESKDVTKLQVICPMCNEESYVFKIAGKIFISSAPNTLIVDTDYINDTHIMKVKIK